MIQKPNPISTILATIQVDSSLLTTFPFETIFPWFQHTILLAPFPPLPIYFFFPFSWAFVLFSYRNTDPSHIYKQASQMVLVVKSVQEQ